MESSASFAESIHSNQFTNDNSLISVIVLKNHNIIYHANPLNASSRPNEAIHTRL
jgi:hypothetical protein